MDGALVPEGEENEGESGSEQESDEEKDVLDVMKATQFGERKGDRKRKQIKQIGSYMINSQQIAMTDDSE
jgi:hypothetical protein